MPSSINKKNRKSNDHKSRAERLTFYSQANCPYISIINPESDLKEQPKKSGRNFSK